MTTLEVVDQARLAPELQDNSKPYSLPSPETPTQRSSIHLYLFRYLSIGFICLSNYTPISYAHDSIPMHVQKHTSIPVPLPLPIHTTNTPICIYIYIYMYVYIYMYMYMCIFVSVIRYKYIGGLLTTAPLTSSRQKSQTTAAARCSRRHRLLERPAGPRPR